MINDYARDTCHRCFGDPYCKGTKMPNEYRETWVRDWMVSWTKPNAPLRGFIGSCIGCHNVAIEKCKVMGILLYKLDLRVDGFDDKR